jgi:hypothetical protein
MYYRIADQLLAESQKREAEKKGEQECIYLHAKVFQSANKSKAYLGAGLKTSFSLCEKPSAR